MSNSSNSKRTSLSLAAIALATYGSYGLSAPAKPVIAWLPDTATTNNINVHWDMWWGENASHWRLLANNQEKCTEQLSPNDPEAQNGQCDISLADGQHDLVVEICNASGCIQSDSKLITIAATGTTTPPPTNTGSAQAPAKPVLDWLPTTVELTNSDVNLNLTWNMWWGVNGDHWRLLQNGQPVYDEVITAQATNTAQTASTQASLSSTGNYTFQVELCNTFDGVDTCTASDIVTVAVVDPNVTIIEPPIPPEPPEWELGEYNVPYENTSGKVVASYFVEWGVYGRNYHVANIPAANLTHILYGFIAICGDNASALASARTAIDSECADQSDDTVTLVDRYATLEKTYTGDAWDAPIKGNFGQLIKLKQQNPDIKILPSIGGWTLSDPFFDIANDPARRATFVASAIEFIKQYDFFDGIDIDWEYPGGNGANLNKGSAADAQGFADLMTELRTALDTLQVETGRTYQLTAAINVSADKVAKVNYLLAAPQVDYFFAMSYDFYGAWNNEVGHHSALHPMENGANVGKNVSDGLYNLLNAGVPANKIVVGAAMYGRGWKGVVDGQGNGAIDGSWEAGVLDYKDIEVNYLGGENGTGINGFSYQYDAVAEAASLFRSSTGEYITYDNPRSVRAKGEFVLNNNLAGLFSWEIDADNGHILNAMHAGLGHTSTDTTTAPNPPVEPEPPTSEFYSINISELQAKEVALTNTPEMEQVKYAIATLDNSLVELITAGNANNPANVQRIEAILSISDWDYLFPKRATEYTYNNFLKAAGKFPAFCGDYSDGRDADLICRKSLATMFAHFSQETGGHTSHWDVAEWRQGLYWLRETGWTEDMRGGYNSECNPDIWQGQTWPCGAFTDGAFKSYFGRGAKQLSYNYNYGPFSEAMFGDVRTLLDNPELVADTWLNLASAVFFYVYPQPPKPSMLHVVDGTWQPNVRDLNNGLLPGFGVTTQIINGGVECGGSVEVQQSLNRIHYYQNFTDYLNVPVPNDEVLGCKGMQQFGADGSGALLIYWERDWNWSAETPDGQSYACQLVGYQTPFSAFKTGDYVKCVDHHFDVNIIE